MFSKRRDGLSLSEALPDRSLFVLVAMMGFLAALTLAGASGAQALAARWAAGAAQLVTIQVPDPDQPASPPGGASLPAPGPQAQGNGPAADQGTDQAAPPPTVAAPNAGGLPATLPPEASTGPGAPSRAQAVLAQLAGLPPGTEVHRLSAEEISRLLAPWLGASDRSALPLPAVIRVTLPQGAYLPPTLEQNLAAKVPGVIVEQNALWSERLHSLANSLLTCAGLALLTVGGIAALITGQAAHTGLATRRDIIATLHSLGAPDGYIAGRFARRTASLAFGGGLVGALLACPPLLFLLRMAAPFGSMTPTVDSPDLTTAPAQAIMASFDLVPQGLLGGLAALPVAAALICWLTTQVMVRLWLRRLP
nr:cell division protein FtsX [Acetobacter garciniae]